MLDACRRAEKWRQTVCRYGQAYVRHTGERRNDENYVNFTVGLFTRAVGYDKIKLHAYGLMSVCAAAVRQKQFLFFSFRQHGGVDTARFC